MAQVRPLVWINAFPGTGKHTVAKELVTLFGPSDKVRLVHNHSLIDPVEARFSRSHPDYQKERRRVRQTAFAELVVDPSTLSTTVIFTGT